MSFCNSLIIHQFAGIFQAPTHIVRTTEGLILIDPGYRDGLYLLINSIYKLGFRPEEIKYIINTHWHGDHTEATAALADLSGAKTIIGRNDREKALRYFTPDILVGDGGNRFINDKLWGEFLDFCEQRLDAVIAEDFE